LAGAYERAGASCLAVDGVDDELWRRFFTGAEGDNGAKLKSSLLKWLWALGRRFG